MLTPAARQLGVLADVRRVDRERRPERPRVAGEEARARLRRVEPLVGVERDRVGPLDAVEQRPQRRRERRRAAVGRVDVQPQVVPLAEVGDRPEAGRSRPWRWCRRWRRRRTAGARQPRRRRSRARARRPACGTPRRSGSSARPAPPSPSCRRPRRSWRGPPARRRGRDRSPSMPSARTSPGARASRAALSAVKFDAAPPLVIRPPAPVGSPNRSAIQRMRCSSSSVAPGERLHPPTFGLRPAASRSAAAPGTVPEPETYARKPGWPHSAECSKTSGRRSAAISSGGSGAAGIGSIISAATSPAAAMGVTGSSPIRSRSSAHRSSMAPGQLPGLARPPVEVADRLRLRHRSVSRPTVSPGGRLWMRRTARSTPGHERLARGRVVADRERLAGRAEDDLLVGHEAGKADGVDRRVAADPRGRRERGAGRGIALRVGVELDDLGTRP